MSADADDRELFPELDAAGALRAAFRQRASGPRASEQRASATGSSTRAGLGQPEARVGPRGYEPQGEIARGGMGVVLRAFDRDLERDVALKVLRDELAHEPRHVRRFLEEARVTARLDHPGIVPVHEVGRDPGGRPFFAMRLVRGRDLLRIVELSNAEREGWSLTRSLGVFLRVCEAMAYAHDRGVLHRDLKPSNVMVGELGEVYVMDWGLARLLDRDDAHDLRLRERTGDGNESCADVESPVVTMDGDVLGTPCYMSPEQAQGRIAELGPRSDVYAVGAMLYHLLTGEMPYVPAGTSVHARIVLSLVQHEPPRPLHELRADLPAELIAICERAMERDPLDRYPDMLAMAEDLRAFLERRVVRAYETGPWAEARKWVRRNKGLATASAAAILALVCGLVASLVLRARARASEQVATLRADDVFRLSALQELDDLSAEADRLWPAELELVPRYRDWLERAQELVDELPRHEAKLIELRARAVPRTAEQAAERRAAHPRRAELERAERELAYRRKLAAVSAAPERARDPSAEEAGVDLATLPVTAAELDALARPLIERRRSTFGGEARGLFLARRAVGLAASLPAPERAPIRDTLAWALFATGRFDEAMLEEERALEEAGAEGARLEQSLDLLVASIEAEISPEGLENAEQRMAELESRVTEIEAEISAPPEATFADTQDRWWHNQLEKLVEGLKAFSDPETGLFSSGVSAGQGWGMSKRLEFARTIVERSVSGPEAAARWSEALASIRATSECPMYEGLALVPQLGLLPIGRDPDSGLWEFAHLQTGEAPERGPGGKLLLEEETGLVFVLIPGGTFWMGAQQRDPTGKNHDPEASDDEGPVHQVSLSPYFLSKYEMTQGQWSRLTATDPSNFGASRWDTNWSANRQVWSSRHPVEMVSWTDCSRTLTRSSLVLPTEAQWECACRAGTSSTFWSGDDPESLRGAVNLSDSYAKTHGSESLTVWEPWLDDGATLHAQVGSYRANPFGLHDTHGNVWEWCRDGHGSYRREARTGDGERQVTGASSRIYRGGSFGTATVHARSAFRFLARPDYANDNLGLRPARNVSY